MGHLIPFEMTKWLQGDQRLATPAHLPARCAPARARLRHPPIDRGMAVPHRGMTPHTRAMHADTFNVPLVIQLTDDEKFLWKDMKVQGRGPLAGPRPTGRAAAP
jgi:hypothetical protein